MISSCFSKVVLNREVVLNRGDGLTDKKMKKSQHGDVLKVKIFQKKFEILKKFFF